jgi:hypothetical protein
LGELAVEALRGGEWRECEREEKRVEGAHRGQDPGTKGFRLRDRD